MMALPNLDEEKLLWAQGYRLVAGIDEVGRGPLAGPVVAAALILPTNIQCDWLCQVKDSKQLPERQRESLFEGICQAAVATGVGVVPAETVDSLGIIAATRLAVGLAIHRLSPPPDFLLLDGARWPDITLPHRGIVGGDQRCLSIACASIIAKVTRDRLMIALDQKYPGYGFAQNKGYGTAQHLAALHKIGPCPIHRRSFSPVRALCGER